MSGLERRIKRAQQALEEQRPKPPPLEQRYIPSDTKTCGRAECGLVLIAHRVPAPPEKIRGGTVCVCACGRWFCYDCFELESRRPKLSIAKVCACGQEELR